MAILDQYGQPVPNTPGASSFDLTDPLIAAMWSRQMKADMERPSLFDGPRIVDESGRPVTSAAPGARIGIFLGSALDGCPLVSTEKS